MHYNICDVEALDEKRQNAEEKFAKLTKDRLFELAIKE